MNDMTNLAHRFNRFSKLVGSEALERLSAAHVIVVGLGGVGSWAAESIMRSGVGKLTLIDFDDVCVMNFNRQIQALEGRIGESKALVLAERLRSINSDAEVVAIARFLDAETIDEMIGKHRPNYVIDAIDHVTTKCFLIDYCRKKGIPVVSSTGAGGRTDPTRVRVTDLALTGGDPLARTIRRVLRHKYGFPAKGEFGIKAVYSEERPLSSVVSDEDVPLRCSCPKSHNEHQSCDKRRVVMGTASFVTGTFGLVCASVVINSLISFQDQ